jgi:GntR family transcriptional repressor for pyruvate dehydrogenase complex
MIDASKTAHRLLFDIVRDIAAEGLEAGDRLPSQAAMAQQYGAGITPLREALRMLELSGLISVRPGPTAGATVRPVGPEHLSVLVAAHLTLGGVTYGALFDAWAATEPLLAAAAAANPDREAVSAAIGPFVTEEENDAPMSAANAFAFHEAVARAAGNPALSLVGQMLSYVVADHYWTSTGVSGSPRQIRHDHIEVAKAIQAGDAGRAHLLMAAHAQESARGVLERIGRSRTDRFVLAPLRAGAAAYRPR